MTRTVGQWGQQLAREFVGTWQPSGCQDEQFGSGTKDRQLVAKQTYQSVN